MFTSIPIPPCSGLAKTPFRFIVNLEVLPKVELGQYKGIDASRRIRPVSEADVDRLADGLREASASLQPVENRGSQLGDTVTVNFHGKFLDAPEEEDINVQDVDVTLGSEGVQKEFTDNLLDVRVDDEKTFVVDYPSDFSSKGLAGKKVEYTAKVGAVRIKELPEVDDEWARSLGEEFDQSNSANENSRGPRETRRRGSRSTSAKRVNGEDTHDSPVRGTGVAR